mmetsp:Transcript_139910/g.389981  ORF Transcript_139910/g.389981 Transcript_139910/m.389981 type:complete len:98 (-) Transcript_139910:33-326(-)|eukprot:CAMPEP_0179054718 /NCGR_PEP_ID=MMETSP0796-20121207/22932_1 /TAXON_ID=73915 /ORGANISM="Pyrodinium bahamense, Strain pbaha01" /LENGTH=97 /DNA_ID=CAMNT_0020751353 /DNA_START=868 /DNA_END=1161 /DNA_ORIENTATION=+
MKRHAGLRFCGHFQRVLNASHWHGGWSAVRFDRSFPDLLVAANADATTERFAAATGWLGDLTADAVTIRLARRPHATLKLGISVQTTCGKPGSATGP